MDPRTIKQASAILELILSVGMPTAVKAIKAYSTPDDPTPEEIRALSDRLKKSSYYWQGPQDGG